MNQGNDFIVFHGNWAFASLYILVENPVIPKNIERRFEGNEEDNLRHEMIVITSFQEIL
jgi:hypothetical protein